MRLRFRIRTLMLVVVGVALVSAALVELPESGYFLILLIPAVGPLIGASWVARGYQPNGFDPISGGLAGGFLQALLILLIAMCVSAVSASQGVADPTGAWRLILDLGPLLLAVHGVYGLCCGLFVSWVLLASPLFDRAFQVAKKRSPGRRDGSPSSVDRVLGNPDGPFEEIPADSEVPPRFHVYMRRPGAEPGR